MKNIKIASGQKSSDHKLENLHLMRDGLQASLHAMGSQILFAHDLMMQLE